MPTVQPSFLADSQNHTVDAAGYATGYIGVRYIPNDHQATGAPTTLGGERMAFYYPGDGTNSADNARRCGWPDGVFGLVFVYIGFTGFTASSNTIADGSATIVNDATYGLFWLALMLGVVFVGVQVIPADATGVNASVTGRGFFHAPGTIERRYEGGTVYGAKVYRCAYQDAKFVVQHLRFYAKRRYNIDPEGIILGGNSAGGHTASMVGMSPNTGTHHGTGGQYDMSTVPNALYVSATWVWDWKRNVQSGGTQFTPAWFPQAETGGGAIAVAANLASAPGGASNATLYDYQRAASIEWLCGGMGPEYCPTTLYTASQTPSEFNFGMPATLGVTTGAGEHDSANGFIAKSIFKEKITMVVTASTLDSVGTATPPPNFDYLYKDELLGLYDEIMAAADASLGNVGYTDYAIAGNITDSPFSRWLLKLKSDKRLLRRWDSVMPSRGIERKQRVESVGCMAIPPNPARNSTRIFNVDEGSDLLVGSSERGAVQRIAPGASAEIGGSAGIWVKADPVQAQFLSVET
jgi:hypothetical protein